LRGSKGGKLKKIHQHLTWSARKGRHRGARVTGQGRQGNKLGAEGEKKLPKVIGHFGQNNEEGRNCRRENKIHLAPSLSTIKKTIELKELTRKDHFARLMRGQGGRSYHVHARRHRKENEKT